MRRKAFCVVADIESRRFDTLLTRGQVPFTKSKEGWGEYSLDDAFRLRLMLDLVDNGGCDIATAIQAIMVGFTTAWLDKYPLTREPPREDIWLAIASITYPNGDEFDVSTDYVVGGYGDIHKLVQGIGENVARLTSGTDFDVPLRFEGDENDPIYQAIVAKSKVDLDYRPGRIIMVNASLAARKVTHAAALLELELLDDDFPRFPDNAPNSLEDYYDAIDGWKKCVARVSSATVADGVD